MAMSYRTGVSKGYSKMIPATVEAFEPLLRAAPKDGVTVLRDQTYGEDPRQILDVYRPTASSGAPVVIFVHGGAYMCEAMRMETARRIGNR
jgi:acetyl esterase/lipase